MSEETAWCAIRTPTENEIGEKPNLEAIAADNSRQNRLCHALRAHYRPLANHGIALGGRQKAQGSRKRFFCHLRALEALGPVSGLLTASCDDRSRALQQFENDQGAAERKQLQKRKANPLLAALIKAEKPHVNVEINAAVH